MGINSLFLVMHDYADDIRRYPGVAATLLGRGPELLADAKKNGGGNFGNAAFRTITYGIDFHPQALTPVASFHSSEQRFFMAAGNCIREVQVIGRESRGGKRYVTLEID